ncbi:MAG: PKD domain-containing protein [Candidatus Pacebacteria bacterium]|nr:PKD domain-containing protein [Candidatus Paceibacterota bacterium]
MIFSKKSLLVKSSLFVFFLAGLFFVSPNVSHATCNPALWPNYTRTWIGPATGVWSDGNNWSAITPRSGCRALLNGDSVIIPSGGGVVDDLIAGVALRDVTISGGSVRDDYGFGVTGTLTMNAGTGITFIYSDYGGLNISGNAVINGSFSNCASIACISAARVSFTGSGKTLSGTSILPGTWLSGSYTISSGSNFTFGGAAYATRLDSLNPDSLGGTWINNGTVTASFPSGGGTWTQGASGILNTCGIPTATLNAVAQGNIVNYIGSCTVKPTSYSILKINGVGSLSGATSLQKLFIGDQTANSSFLDNGWPITLLSTTLSAPRLTMNQASTYGVDAPAMASYGTYTLDLGTTVAYRSNSAQTIATIPSPGFANLSLFGGGVKTAPGNLTVRGNFLNSAGVTYDPTASNYNLTVGGNFTNAGTFITRSPWLLTLNPINVAVSVLLNAPTALSSLMLSPTGTTTRQFNFTSSNPNALTVPGTFTANGASGALISLRSVTNGTQWFINPNFATTSVSYLDVKDGGCTSNSPLINPANSNDTANNGLCWFPATITVSPPSLITTEGAANQTFTITLSKTSTTTVTIPISIIATPPATTPPSPARITLPVINVVIPAGSLTATTTVTTVDDAINNDTEYSTIKLSPASVGSGIFTGIDPSDIPVTSIDNDIGSTTNGTAGNVTGWAWGGDGPNAADYTTAGGAGRISMNCRTGGTDGSTNPVDNIVNSVCGAHDYGVNVAPSGKAGQYVFSGYAWSDNFGWLSFNAADVAGCPVPLASPLPPCQGNLDNLQSSPTRNKVTGWARFLSRDNGWDGWVELSGTNHASPDTTGNNGVTYTLTKFVGYGWGGDPTGGGIGWIQFYDVHLPPAPGFSCQSVQQGTTLKADFTCSVSGGSGYDSCTWNFGDSSTGTSSATSTITHTYASTGTYSSSVSINDSGSGITGTANCPVTISPPLPIGLDSCAPDDTTPLLNSVVTWTAYGAHGGDGTYSYSWGGDDGFSAPSSPIASTTWKYTSLGPKNAHVIVSSGGATPFTRNCTPATVVQAFDPATSKCSLLRAGNLFSVPKINDSFNWKVTATPDSTVAGAKCDYVWSSSNSDMTGTLGSGSSPTCAALSPVISGAVSYSASGTKSVNLQITAGAGTPTSTVSNIPCSWIVIDPNFHPKDK